jgi:hypothetical protein
LKATPTKTDEKRGRRAMDEYQEELLEFQAYELDTPETAEDATEL